MDRRTWKEPVGERIVAEGLFLEHRAVLRIARGAGLLVSAHGGTLWITQEGDPHDIIVQSGRWHRLALDTLAIVHALQPASVTISAPLGVSALWTIDGVAPDGRPSGLRIGRRSHGHRVTRNVWAWVLRRYRSGAQAARRVRQSARDAAVRDGIERLAAQLDARTRRDVGLGEFHGASPGERAERYRWRQEFSWPPRESTFI